MNASFPETCPSEAPAARAHGRAPGEPLTTKQIIGRVVLLSFFLFALVWAVQGGEYGTTDLLGQMAADDYVDKLPVLYSEFAEEAQFSGDATHFVASFNSAKDLIERTPSFWKDLVLTRLESDLSGLYRFLNHPYPSGPNHYLERIAANLRRLEAERNGAVGQPRTGS